MKSAALNLELLTAAVNSIPADELSVVRNDAAKSFARTNFPTLKDEDWKYTNLTAAAKLGNDWLTHSNNVPQEKMSPDTPGTAIIRIMESIDAHWLIINNGFVDASSCEIISDAMGDGVEITLLSKDIAADDIHTDDPMSAFNAALLRDGLRIRTKPNARPNKPLGMIFIDDGYGALSQSRILVDCEENSRLQIVECAISKDDSQFANHVGQVSLAAGARLDYVRIQQRDHAHLGINRLTATLEKHAHFNHCAFDFGSALVRNDVIVEILGAGAKANLHGLYLANGEQHIDNHLCVNHAVGPAVSRQDYRGILNGRSRCVFNGKARVLRGADGTDASQSNHNLLLSDRAEIDTKPELEIYADDVKCSHGATVGQLDEAAIFYLQSRGLSRNDAKQVLTRAFATEILTDLTVDACRTYLTTALEARLADLIENDISAGGRK